MSGNADSVFDVRERPTAMMNAKTWLEAASKVDYGVSMIVKAEGPSGRAKIRSDDPKHALGLVHYLRTIGYNAWIEDTNGNEIEETVLKNAIK
jgi:hypothetical protein